MQTSLFIVFLLWSQVVFKENFDMKICFPPIFPFFFSSNGRHRNYYLYENSLNGDKLKYECPNTKSISL